MTVLNPDGSIAMINNKGCEILGLPEKDIINKNWFDHFIPESMRENLREVFTKSFSIGEDDLTSVGLYEYGNPILTADGNIRHIEWRNVLLRDIDGKIIGMLSSGLDVTEQREALQKMKESDERLREFGNTLDQLLWIVEDGKVIYSTSAMERVWGIKDTAGNFQVFMDMILPEDREFVTAIVRKHMNGIFSPSVFEYRFVHPLTGETRWLQTKAFKSDFPGKNRFIGLTQDITFKKKIEQELLNALEQSKQLNELKNNFISIVSHEIRTPLSVILTSAEYLRKFESDLSFEEKKKYYERIEIAVDQLSVLVENVKLLHKEQLKVEVHKAEEFNAVFLVEELIDAISIAHNRKINLNIQNNGDEILLYQDQNIVRYVYSNIITNAVKFSAQGIPVDVTLDRLDGFALLTVTDKGIGIPEGIEQKIFEPFWRAPNAGNIAGSGLGLTIASKFAQLIGGDITYASKAGEGTAFFVKIPLMQ
jgi:PAS domain S-box-containing protein